MLFGLATTPATFQLYSRKCLADKLNVFCIVFLDDILVYTSEKRAKHKETVRWVLGQLRKYGLNANLKKCRLNNDKIHFLEYIVSSSGVQIESVHIESIKNQPEVKSIREIQVFIDFANFNQQFIRSISAIAGTLTSMFKTGQGSKFFKPANRDTTTLSQPNIASFLTPEVKDSF